MLLAPASTCCGSTRLCALRSKYPISPCRLAASQFSNCRAVSGGAAVAKWHASNPSSSARCCIAFLSSENSVASVPLCEIPVPMLALLFIEISPLRAFHQLKLMQHRLRHLAHRPHLG